MPSSNRNQQNTWLTEKFLERKLPQLDLFKREYLGDFASEYPQETECPPSAFVVAESYHLFRMSHLPQHYKYLSRLPEDIRGRADCTLILFGRYWRRKDWDDEILEYCHQHNISVIQQKFDD